MQIIELVGGPGAGKSTTAHQLVACIKKHKMATVAFIEESVKIHCYGDNKNISAYTQYMTVFDTMSRLAVFKEEEVQSVVLDFSPLLCKYYHKGLIINSAYDAYVSFINNIGASRHIFLKTRADTTYQTEGRLHDEAAALKIDKNIGYFMRDSKTSFTTIDSYTDIIHYIE